MESTVHDRNGAERIKTKNKQKSKKWHEIKQRKMRFRYLFRGKLFITNLICQRSSVAIINK